MRIIDITRTLDGETAAYPGDPMFEKCDIADFAHDGYRLSRLSLCAHTGTHIDAPSHYIENGADACDISLGILVGKCLVCRDADDIANGLDGGIRRFLLLCPPTNELIERLVSGGALLIGTQELTVGDDDLHKAVLSDGIALLENLELKDAAPGEYTVVALPLKLRAEGAPARVILIENDMKKEVTV